MTISDDKVVVRELRAEDQEQWSQLWLSYIGFYRSEVSDDVVETTFSRLLGDDSQDFSCFVAEKAGTLVGLTHYGFHRHCWKIENVCYLQDLFADPAVRGLGIGRKLIEAVYKAADANGTPIVYWTTQQDNKIARQLYDRIADLTPFIKY